MTMIVIRTFLYKSVDAQKQPFADVPQNRPATFFK